MTSLIFPGQGSQYIGMAKDFYDNFNVSKNIFHEVEETTSIPVRKIIFENNDEINLTKFTQICIFTASMSIFKALEETIELNNSNIDKMLGHSLGEYTALAASGKLNLSDASKLLKIRGALMNDAVTPNLSGMAALIGLSSNEIEKIISENKIKVYIANDNSNQQVVISGMIDDINESKNIFLSNGIKKFVLLNVSSAFHSPIMFDAQNSLQEVIDQTKFIENNVSIISNFTGNISNQINIIKNSVINQMANRVRWTESINTLANTKDFKIIEIGPGKVLSGLIKRINNNFSINSVNSINDLNDLM